MAGEVDWGQVAKALRVTLRTQDWILQEQHCCTHALVSSTRRKAVREQGLWLSGF